MLKRINFVTVAVADQARALDFYTTKLGLRVFTDQTLGDMRWIELQVPHAETRVVLFKDDAHRPDPHKPSLAFVADNVVATYEELRSKGVAFTTPPTKAPWGEHAIFKDSEGNLVLFAKG